jgi:D-lactate dehydrogenase (cytochrome)
VDPDTFLSQKTQAINKYSGQSLPVTPTLFFEFHGSEKGVEESARQAREVAQEHGGQVLLLS